MTVMDLGNFFDNLGNVFSKIDKKESIIIFKNSNLDDKGVL